MTDGEITGDGDTPTGGAKRPLTKTPMFTARNSARYERQELIKQIDEAEGSHLICYVGGPTSQIDRNDIIGLSTCSTTFPRTSRLTCSCTPLATTLMPARSWCG